MSHTKIEFDDENFGEKIILACGVGSRVAMMSRSSGSGETCHSSIVKSGDNYQYKAMIASPRIVAFEEDLPVIVRRWFEHACTRWVEGSGLTVFPLDQVKRNRNGKLPMYVRVTE